MEFDGSLAIVVREAPYTHPQPTEGSPERRRLPPNPDPLISATALETGLVVWTRWSRIQKCQQLPLRLRHLVTSYIMGKNEYVSHRRWHCPLGPIAHGMLRPTAPGRTDGLRPSGINADPHPHAYAYGNGKRNPKNQ